MSPAVGTGWRSVPARSASAFHTGRRSASGPAAGLAPRTARACRWSCRHRGSRVRQRAAPRAADTPSGGGGSCSDGSAHAAARTAGAPRRDVGECATKRSATPPSCPFRSDFSYTASTSTFSIAGDTAAGHDPACHLDVDLGILGHELGTDLGVAVDLVDQPHGHRLPRGGEGLREPELHRAARGVGTVTRSAGQLLQPVTRVGGSLMVGGRRWLVVVRLRRFR